jgi:hypothetical protein
MKTKVTRRPDPGAAALRDLINTIPDAAKCPLPVGQPDFTKCSRAIAQFAGAAASQPLPFPSALLPFPL